MLRLNDGRIYTGATTDPARRLRQHRSGKGARTTRAFGVSALIYLERTRGRSAALRREYRIKQLPRKEKLELASAFRKRAAPRERAPGASPRPARASSASSRRRSDRSTPSSG